MDDEPVAVELPDVRGPDRSVRQDLTEVLHSDGLSDLAILRDQLGQLTVLVAIPSRGNGWALHSEQIPSNEALAVNVRRDASEALTLFTFEYERQAR